MEFKEVSEVNSIVVYASRHGNTEKIAFAIAAGLRPLGSVQVLEIAKAPKVIPEEVQLIVLGGPTEAHRMTPAIVDYLDRLGDVSGKSAAAFDTRLRWPRWLSGSAGAGIAERLRRGGATMVTGPESFFVTGKEPVLEPGELERAEGWARSLTDRAVVVGSPATVAQ